MTTSIQPMRVGDQEVYVEIEHYGEEEVAAVSKILDRVENAFEGVRQTIINMAQGVVSAIDELGEKGAPDEFTLEFSLKIGAEGQIILTKLGGEAQIKITLLHRHKPNSS